MIDVAAMDITTTVYSEMLNIIGDDLYESYDTNEKAVNALKQIVIDAVNEVIRIRNYPASYTQEMIASDVERYHSTVTRAAMYEWDTLGASNETMHIENNVQRMWRERSSLFSGVVPIGRVI